ncbi:MAG: DnaJ C-terminal domain-containing protein [Panacagrimonas sp.]
MDFKDYYAVLGVERTATQAQIKSAYRKLARKYHPDVSKEPDAEARFKDVAEAYEALNDEERRAAYDDVGKRHKSGQEFNPPPGWDSGFEFSGRDFGAGGTADHSAFFEALFRRAGAQGPRGSAHATAGDHHAKVQIELQHAYRGGHHSISLRTPRMEADGQMTMQDRKLDVNIPKGIRPGQHLRLAGQGGAAHGDEPAGDLYLEIEFAPHPHFRVDGRDVYLDLPVAPWEATLGATVTVPMPDGSVQLSLPAGSSAGRKMRLKGKGLPSVPPGDLYAVLSIALPPADTVLAQEAYRGMATSFGDFNPRRALLEA